MVLGPLSAWVAWWGCRSKTAPTKGPGVGQPLAGSQHLSPPKKSLASSARGNDRDLSRLVWGLRGGASSLWMYSLGYSKTRGQLRCQGRENRPNLLMREVSEGIGQGKDAEMQATGAVLPTLLHFIYWISLTFQMGSLKGISFLPKHTAGWQRPRHKNRGTEAQSYPQGHVHGQTCEL